MNNITEEIEIYLIWLNEWASNIFNMIDEQEIVESCTVADLLKDMLGEYENQTYLRPSWLRKHETVIAETLQKRRKEL